MRRQLRQCAALTITIAGGAPLAAQDAADTTAAVPVAPVVVTVLRTPLALATAPFSVSVRELDAPQRAQPGLALDEVLRGIPGVQVENRHNYAVGERITIRGFGARAQFGVRGVRVLVDGIPATLPDGQTTLEHVDPQTIARVEVVRGPASAVHGNAAGGVIQLESRLAPTDGLHHELGLGGGAHDAWRVQGGTGGRVGDAAFVVAAGQLRYGGYREFSEAENRYLGGRLAVARGANTVRLMLGAASYDAQNTGSLSEELLAADRLQAFRNNVLQRTGKTGSHLQLGARWQHRRAGGEWEVAAYGVGREVVNPIPARVIDLDRTGGGVRVLYHAGTGTPGAALRWSIGVEADGQWDDRQNHVNERGERGALVLDQRERVVGLGGFAQVAAEPVSRLTLLAGARYDVAGFRVRDRFVTATDPDDSGSRAMRAFSPSVGMALRLAQAVRLFANVATAFETPTTTELANRPTGAGGFNPELEPQRTVSVELGAGGELGGRAGYQLTFFHARARNALIPFEVPEAPGRQFFRNAGSSEHRGAELGLHVRPVGPLRAELAYSLADVRFVEYRTASASYDGNRMPGVTPQRAELRLSLELPRGAFVESDTRTVTRVAANDANTAFSPGYVLTDLRAGLRSVPLGRLDVRPFAGITNLTDARYNTSVVVNAFGDRYFEPGPGRAVHLGVRAALRAR